AVRVRSASERQPPDRGASVSGPPPAPRRSPGARWTMVVAATLTPSVVAGAMYAAGQFGQRDAKGIDVVLDGSTASTKATAEQLRAGALDACKRGRWQECIDGLATARTLDPPGDAEPHVQEVWRAARDGLERQKPSGPTGPDSKQRLPTGPDRK
ncbi:MAG: hypothetical protein M3O46_08980, partial [Myxococcota bacterium]|nr:hypothetical protein [Myxococcota bacterium]